MEFRETVGQAIGRASVAWSELPGGVFDSTTCCELVDGVVAAYEAELAALKAERDQYKHEFKMLQAGVERVTKERDKLKQDLHLAVSNAGKDLIAERDHYKTQYEAEFEVAQGYHRDIVDLKRKLEIAVKALKAIVDRQCTEHEPGTCPANNEQRYWGPARAALAEIEGEK